MFIKSTVVILEAALEHLKQRNYLDSLIDCLSALEKSLCRVTIRAVFLRPIGLKVRMILVGFVNSWECARIQWSKPPEF